MKLSSISNHHVAAILLMNDAREILIVKRGSSAPWMPSKWALPGGIVEPDETPTAAIIRECEEELSITPNNVALYQTLEYPKYILYLFTGASAQAPQLNYENTDFVYIDKNQLQNYEFVPGIAEVLDKYL